MARTENAKAWSHLARARTLFDELGAPLWLARSLIRLGEADDPVELGDIAAPTVAEIDRVSGLLENVASKDAAQLRRQLSELRSSLALTAGKPSSSRF
jgi:HAMP domain-containing protein